MGSYLLTNKTERVFAFWSSTFYVIATMHSSRW